MLINWGHYGTAQARRQVAFPASSAASAPQALPRPLWPPLCSGNVLPGCRPALATAHTAPGRKFDWLTPAAVPSAPNQHSTAPPYGCARGAALYQVDRVRQSLRRNGCRCDALGTTPVDGLSCRPLIVCIKGNKRRLWVDSSQLAPLSAATTRVLAAPEGPGDKALTSVRLTDGDEVAGLQGRDRLCACGLTAIARQTPHAGVSIIL